MYHAYWGLKETPFAACPQADRFFVASPCEEAIARFEYLLSRGHRLGLLLGPPGSGKTLLLEVLGRQARQKNHQVAIVPLLGLGPDDLLHELAIQWGLAEPHRADPRTLWCRVTDRIVEVAYEQRSTAILLDDADQARPETLDAVLRLVQFRPWFHTRLTLVMAARGDRLALLGERILESAQLRMDLEPWDRSEIEAYLRTTLAKAGCDRAIFDPAAVERLCELSGGIPRHVNHLAELALAAAAGDGCERIDLDTVEKAYLGLAVVES